MIIDINPEDIRESKFAIPANLIKTKCSSQTSKTFLVNIVDAKTNNITVQKQNDSNIFISIILEYPSEGVLLPDGIAYTTTFGKLSSDHKLFKY